MCSDYPFTIFMLLSIILVALLPYLPPTIPGVEGAIGVNYGTMANNLPPPADVARFLVEHTVIDRVRIFDSDQQILKAFAHTEIAITVTIPNDEIPNMTNLTLGRQWVQKSISPHIASTKIIRILVGNEVLSTGNKLLIENLVPAMQTLHVALVEVSLSDKIKVSTPHSLGIITNSTPPSNGRFRQGYDVHVLKPLLGFLSETNSPFMINPYPFFGLSSDTLDYALFRPNSGVMDENTGLNYTNMLDAQLDAVYSAMKALGFDDVDIVVAETGWPTQGDLDQVGVDPESAYEYNFKLIQHVTSGLGTPLMANRTLETYVFALFDEDLKPGPTCERNFGLFGPDMKPIYHIETLMKTDSSSSIARNEHHNQYDVLAIVFTWFILFIHTVTTG